MLYLVATPLGNLADITLRALTTLKECDYILCEDTRHSLQLLRHYDIQKPLKSYHKFNEAKRNSEILQDLLDGKNIALISDAGTPCLADPGERLVATCIAHHIPITPIPGPCALITALITTGFPTDRFQFLGFLPKKSGALTRLLQEALSYPGTTLAYETPHRITKVLALFHTLAPNSPLVIARELTKKFEEILRGTPGQLLERCTQRPLKGELVLAFQGEGKRFLSPKI